MEVRLPKVGIAEQREWKGFGITFVGCEICHVSLEEEPGLCEEHSPPDTSLKARDSKQGSLTSVWVLYHRH